MIKKKSEKTVLYAYMGGEGQISLFKTFEEAEQYLYNNNFDAKSDGGTTDMWYYVESSNDEDRYIQRCYVDLT